MKSLRGHSSIWHTEGNEQFFKTTDQFRTRWLKHAMLVLLGRSTISSWVIYLPFIALFLYLSGRNSGLPLSLIVPWLLSCFLVSILRSIFAYYLLKLSLDSPLERYEFVSALLCAVLAILVSSGTVYFFQDIDYSWRLILLMMIALLGFGSVFTLSMSLLSFSLFTVLLIFPVAYIGIKSSVSAIFMTSASLFFMMPLLFYFSISFYKLFSERMRKELSLLSNLELEKKLSSLLKPEMFVSFEDRIIAVNDYLLDRMKIEASDILNQTIDKIFPKQSQMIRNMQKLHFTVEKKGQGFQEVFSPEFAISVNQGDRALHFSVSCHLILSHSRDQVFVWVLKDISYQHYELRELRKKEHMYRSLVEVSEEMLLCLDVNMSIVFSNERGAREIFGFSMVHVSSQNFWDLFCEKDIFTEEDLHQVMDMKTTIYKEASIRSLSTGTRKRVRIMFSPFHHREEGVFFVASVSEIQAGSHSEDHMSYLATHDELTGLPNRRYLTDKLIFVLGSLSRRSSDVVALFLIDLDKFKLVNDVYGHKAGDHVLEVSALRLRSCARKTDTVARMGGDEFVMLISSLSSAKDVALIAQRVVDAIAQPIPFGQSKLQVYASVGIALYPLDALSSEAMLSISDQAMYSAKNAGANRYCFHEQRSVEVTQTLIDQYF